MLRAGALSAALFGFWLALSGHYTPLLITFGILSTALVVWLCLRLKVVDEEGVPTHITVRLLLYIPFLLKEIFLANVVVAKIILDPKLPISPRMVEFHGTQSTDLGRFLYANSITLTPGTITTGVEGQDYEIHALSAADLETDEESRMDQKCAHVENG